jgi:hypothetical protein
MPNKIDALYAEVSKTYDVGSIQDFQNYLADPKKRQLFFKDVIAPEYDVKSLDEFEQAYGLKKKEQVSPSQQKKLNLLHWLLERWYQMGRRYLLQAQAINLLYLFGFKNKKPQSHRLQRNLCHSWLLRHKV